MWHRLALLAAIMHPRKPPYITQMSDFLKVFADQQTGGIKVQASYCRWVGASIE
jgi:hypothetical protein